MSAAWLVHQHGFRWDEDGRWTRESLDARSVRLERRAALQTGDVLVVDEAGMLDQDTALALLTIADEAHARVAFMGDRHQLPAVGRGGVPKPTQVSHEVPAYVRPSDPHPGIGR